MPLSSFTEQERSGRHIPPTFATPKVLEAEKNSFTEARINELVKLAQTSLFADLEKQINQTIINLHKCIKLY